MDVTDDHQRRDEEEGTDQRQPIRPRETEPVNLEPERNRRH
jgi:hypothetical protein